MLMPDQITCTGSAITVSFNQGLGTPTQFSIGGSFSICIPARGAAILVGAVAQRPRRRS